MKFKNTEINRMYIYKSKYKQNYINKIAQLNKTHGKMYNNNNLKY